MDPLTLRNQAVVMQAAGTILYGMFYVFVVVVLLNALIAVMSNVYNEVEVRNRLPKYTLVQLWRHLMILLCQHVIITWIQTKLLKHESDDRADNTVYFVCVTNGERRDTSAAKLINICHCIPYNRNPTPGRDIGSCESLVNYDFQNLPTIWRSSFKYTFASS